MTNTTSRLRILATMTRGESKKVIIKRRYAYFDTAMPRMLQLAFTYANEGDFIEITSNEFGFHLGTIRVQKGCRFDVEMNPLVKNSPSLLKLMSEDQSFAYKFD